MLTKKTTVAGSLDGGRRRGGFGFGGITIVLVTIGIALLGAGVYGAWRVFRLQQRGDTMLSENVASIRAAEELETVVREVRYRLKRYLVTGDPRQLERVDGQLPAGQRSLLKAGELAKSTREEDLVARMSEGYRELRTQLETLGDPSAQGSAGDRETPIVDDLADGVIPSRILVPLHTYVAHNEKELAASQERNQANARRLMMGLVLLGSGGGVAGLLTGVLISRRISHTIVQLSVPLQDTAGKLNEVVGPVTVSGQRGFDDLQAVLETVSQRVATVVERFQEREREVLRSEQLAAVGQLAAGMAHELRNPLTAVKAVLQLADAPRDLSPRDLQVIHEEVDRLEQSVQRFLDFARPPNPEKRRVNLSKLIGDSIELLNRRAELKRVRLTFDQNEQDVFVVADASQLRQVFLNLILNGIDAASRGGEVHLSLDSSSPPRPGDGGDPGITVVVSDTGPGLPRGIGERIFDPFVSTKETGLGLGLSICRRIVQAHGGSIVANDSHQEGTPGGEGGFQSGARFKVWIPRHAGDSSDAARGCAEAASGRAEAATAAPANAGTDATAANVIPAPNLRSFPTHL